MGQYFIGSQPIHDICMMLLDCIPFSLMRAFHGIMQMFHIFGEGSVALPLYNVTMILLHWCGLKLLQPEHNSDALFSYHCVLITLCLFKLMSQLWYRRSSLSM